MAQKLNVAVQMDPMESIGIEGDSSFALMLEAQARGHTLFHYEVRHMTLREGTQRPDGAWHEKLFARARPVSVQRVKGDHFKFGTEETLDLGQDPRLPESFLLDEPIVEVALEKESVIGRRLHVPGPAPHAGKGAEAQPERLYLGRTPRRFRRSARSLTLSCAYHARGAKRPDRRSSHIRAQAGPVALGKLPRIHPLETGPRGMRAATRERSHDAAAPEAEP